jgi:hypothetical protein
MPKFSDKRQLEEKLLALTSIDKRRLYKRAAKMRKAAKLQGEAHTKRDDYTRKRRLDTLDDVQQTNTYRPKPTAPLHDWVLQLLDESLTRPDQITGQLAADTKPAQITALTAGGCNIQYESKTIASMLRPEITVGQQTGIAVGDNVLFSTTDDGINIVEEVMPRRTALSRPDPRNPQITRIIAANIDTIVIVASVVAPSLEPNLIDRFLLAVEHSGAEPVLCLNKIDLLKTDELREAELARLDPYRQIGLPVIAGSAENNVGLEPIW